MPWDGTSSFHSREREDGEVDHHDNQLPINQYPPGFPGCVKTIEKRSVGVNSRPSLCCSWASRRMLFSIMTMALHDDAKSSAQADQVGADVIGDHAAESEQHGQRDDQRGNERCAQIAQKQEQHHDYQGGAFEEIGGYVRMDLSTRLVRSYTAVVTTPFGKFQLFRHFFATAFAHPCGCFRRSASVPVPSTTFSPF